MQAIGVLYVLMILSHYIIQQNYINVIIGKKLSPLEYIS